MNAQVHTKVIAEIGQAHDGSLGILHSYIDAIASVGVDIVKFQVHIADAESSGEEGFRKKFSYVDDTRFDYWKRMGLSRDQWVEIKAHCDGVGLEFLATPFSVKAVELLESIDVKSYKIGSGDANNRLLIDVISSTRKPILLSTGMSDYKELDIVVDEIKNEGNELTIFQCTTSYPTQLSCVGINVLNEYTKRYCCPVGLSDHTGSIYPSLIAASCGASFVEVHAVFDKKMFGPDSTSSLTIEELRLLKQGVNDVNIIMNNPVDKKSNNFKREREIFGRSLAVNRPMKAGEILSIDDLECKKPLGMGVPAEEYRMVVGKKLNKDLNKWEFLCDEHITAG